MADHAETTDKELTATPDNAPMNGVASVVKIIDQFFKQLAVLHDESEDNTSQILTLEARMAMTLCHEVTHAYGYAYGYAFDKPCSLAPRSSRLSAIKTWSMGWFVQSTVPTNEPFM